MDKYILVDTTDVDNSIKNLELIFEASEYDNNMPLKVQRWARESSANIGGKLKQKIRNISAKIKHLFHIKSFENGGDVKILVDIQAFNKLAAFIASSKTYKVALFTPANVASYSKTNLTADYVMNKSYRQAKKLQALYVSMKKELNSNKAIKLTKATMEFRTVEINDEIQFKRILVPFIRNMLIATKKMNDMIVKMNKSFTNLIQHINTINRKVHDAFAAKYIRTQKNDLTFRCINYVAYANKLLITTCESVIERMDKILSMYYNLFNEKNM